MYISSNQESQLTISTLQVLSLHCLTRADVPEFDCLITRAGDEKRSCPAGVDVVGDGWRRGVGRCGLVDRRLSGIWRPCHTLYDVIMLP